MNSRNLVKRLGLAVAMAALTVAGVVASAASYETPVLWWSFDGNVQDTSGNGNHGTWSGTAAYSDNAISGQAGSFNNASAVSIAAPSAIDFTSSQSWTLVYALNLNGNEPDNITDRITHRSAGSGLLATSTGTSKLVINPNGGWTWSGVGIDRPDSGWTQIAWVNTGSNFNLYQDGVLTYSRETLASAAGEFSVGGAGGAYLQGYLDDVAWFNLALPTADIATIAESGIAGYMVPEPSTFGLALVALAGLALRRRRR